MRAPLLACVCRAAVDVPSQVSGDSLHVLSCPGCGRPWAAWIHDGTLASQVEVEPGATVERIRYRLGLYGVRLLARDWESAEAKALFVSLWTARRRWEFEDLWGRRLLRLFGLPVVRRLNRAPLWLLERAWRRWFAPEHLRDRLVRLTPADRARARSLAAGRRAEARAVDGAHEPRPGPLPSVRVQTTPTRSTT